MDLNKKYKALKPLGKDMRKFSGSKAKQRILILDTKSIIYKRKN